MLVIHMDNRLVYKVEMQKAGSSDFEYYINMNLVAGWDYINEDSDRQGYVPSNKFVESVQFDQVHVNILDETVLDRLLYEGYEEIKEEDLKIENILNAL